MQLGSKGQILNDHMFRANSSAEYIVRASKVITMVDLAGHERYFKTTAYGLTGHLPDYACLIVGANAGEALLGVGSVADSLFSRAAGCHRCYVLQLQVWWACARSIWASRWPSRFQYFSLSRRCAAL